MAPSLWVTDLGSVLGEEGVWGSDQYQAAELGEAWGPLAFLSPPRRRGTHTAFGLCSGFRLVIHRGSIPVSPSCQRAALENACLSLVLREANERGQQVFLPPQLRVDQAVDPSVLLKLWSVF